MTYQDKDGRQYRITGKHHLTGGPIYDFAPSVKPGEKKKWFAGYYGRLMKWFEEECTKIENGPLM